MLIAAPVSAEAASSNVAFGTTYSVTATQCHEAADGPHRFVVNMPAAGNVKISMSHSDFRIDEEVSADYYFYREDRSWSVDLSGWAGVNMATQTIFLPKGITVFCAQSQRFTDFDSEFFVRFVQV